MNSLISNLRRRHESCTSQKDKQRERKRAKKKQKQIKSYAFFCWVLYDGDAFATNTIQSLFMSLVFVSFSCLPITCVANELNVFYQK